MPRNISLSDSKCWNGGHEWVKIGAMLLFGPIRVSKGGGVDFILDFFLKPSEKISHNIIVEQE